MNFDLIQYLAETYDFVDMINIETNEPIELKALNEEIANKFDSNQKTDFANLIVLIGLLPKIDL